MAKTLRGNLRVSLRSIKFPDSHGNVLRTTAMPKHYIQYLLFSLEAKIVSDVFIFHKKALQSFLSGNETFQKSALFLLLGEISYFGFVLIDKSLLRSIKINIFFQTKT